MMNRRESLGLLALISLGGPAMAQTAKAELSGPEQVHAVQTLEAGSASLEMSRVAISKATAAGVKRFAQAESSEQQTMATVLKSRMAMEEKTKPAIPADGKTAIDKLHDVKTGPDFDKSYVAAQIEGHHKLLQIQESYLSTGKDSASTAIAMLARGHINEHLSTLEILQKELAG